MSELQTKDPSLFDEVDTIINQAVVIGSPQTACEYGRGLQKSAVVRGIALAKLLSGLVENWDKFVSGGVGEDYLSYFEAQMGIRPITVSKYVAMWKSLFEGNLNDDIKQQLLDRPIGDLLLLTAAANDESLDEAQWRDVVAAPDRDTLRNIVRDARGKVTSSNTSIRIHLVIRADGDYAPGTLLAMRAGESEVIGFLVMEGLTELGAEALMRIKTNSKVSEI